ncbi:MAG: hypothetical protein NT029_18435 [Armatimonadetes bacterium]|nr:hypothetical protein [Armatimonadota bacterium]
MVPDTLFKADVEAAKRGLLAWWRREGLALHVTAPRDAPLSGFPAPPPVGLDERWLSPGFRVAQQLHHMAATFYGGVALPIFSTDIGPGSLGLLMGGVGHYDDVTVWYEPSIADADLDRPLALDRSCAWWERHFGHLQAGLEANRGRYLVGMPDLIENLDTLAQLRGNEEVLFDMADRPEWVERSIVAINELWFEAFEAMRPFVDDGAGGNAWGAFAIWGPGRTAKVQCDLACALSPSAFRRCVQPALADQCRRLDYSLFHLDGTNALPQLDNLLSIEHLDAIEWTPQSGRPGGGSPEWYDLYRRIKAGGKAVQVVGATVDEVEPLIDAVGPEGLFIMTWARDEEQARGLLDRCGRPEA